MSATSPRNQTPARRALLGQLPSAMRRYLRTEAGSATVLLALAVVALAWANSPWSAAYHDLLGVRLQVRLGSFAVATDLHHLVNDALMALFFFVIGLEVRREFSVGELTNRSRLVVPVLAGIGGIIVPAAIYLAVAPAHAARGWGIVIGTDTAFLLGALALVGPRFSTQLRIALLTITVIDDIVAVAVIGFVYSGSLDVAWLGVLAAALAAIGLLSRAQVWRIAPYLVGLFVLWVATVQVGLHASIAGMLGGLLIAAREVDPTRLESLARRFRAFQQSPMVSVGRAAGKGLRSAISANERLQLLLHRWVAYGIVPLFAFVNAGVDLRGGRLGQALESPLTWAVVIGLVVGKTVGIALGVAATERLDWGRLPTGVKAGHIAGGAALSGIGFTVSILIANLTFPPGEMRDQAIVGVLVAALAATTVGWLIFQAAARLRGETDADLPRVLDRPVDPAVDHIRGRHDAPLTLVEYGDFECSFCGRATGMLTELRERFGERLRYVFRHVTLPDVHQYSETAARAAEAAALQGRFWEMHDVLFDHQGDLQRGDLVDYATQLDLDVERFIVDLDSHPVAERVRRDVASAEASGVTGAPTFFVGENRHIGPYDAATLGRKLDLSEAQPAPTPADS